MVDGGFYRRRAYARLGDKSPKERADELESYCKRHLNEKIYGIQTSHRLNTEKSPQIIYIEFFIMIVYQFLKIYIIF